MKLSRHRIELVSRMQMLLRITQVLLVVIALSYWGVQVANGDYYRELADHNRLRKVSIDAARGLILDRKGNALVENVPSYSLLLDRSRSENLDSSLDFASRILAEERSSLDQALAAASGPRFKPVLIGQGLSLAQVSRFAVHSLEHPELEVRTDQLRLYRYAHQTAHLLGYLGEVSDRELTPDNAFYRPGDLVGRKGIERRYEELLRGHSGERVVVVDSRGRTIEELDLDEQTPAEAGKNLDLSLDLDLQQEAASLLEGKVGAIVALDPRNGEIRAWVSSPSFDPNLFARRLDPEEWQQLLEDPHKPLQNRVIQNTYPPGSAFKIVMATAALEEGLVDPKKKVFCRGFSRIYDHRYRCWKPSGHGWVDLRDAIKGSCNVYFHHLGQKMDIDTIATYARRFGLGTPTGVDLGGEKSGLVPDRAWSEKARGSRWYPGETISVSIGQGPLLATPLQMAVMISAVANGGALVVPHLRLGVDVPAQRKIQISAPTLSRLRDTLWAVVNEDGTGKSAFIEGFEIAGKTGTSQVVRQETWTDNKDLAAEQRDHAWFVSYGPVEEPRLAVVVFVEHGGGGSKVAAPLAKALYEKFLETGLPNNDPI